MQQDQQSLVCVFHIEKTVIVKTALWEHKALKMIVGNKTCIVCKSQFMATPHKGCVDVSLCLCSCLLGMWVSNVWVSIWWSFMRVPAK